MSEMLSVRSETVFDNNQIIPVMTAAEVFFVQTMGLVQQSKSLSEENQNDINHIDFDEPECSVPPVESRFPMWERPSDDEDSDWEREDSDSCRYSDMSDSDVGSDTSDDDYRSKVDNKSDSGDNSPVAEHDGTLRAAPTILTAHQAYIDIQLVLRPCQNNGQGYKDLGLDLLLRTRLEWIKAFLWVYVDENNDLPQDANGARWIVASLRAANTAQKGPWFSQQLCEWTRAYILDWKNLPVNIYGTWNRSQLEDEDLANEIALHLQGIGKWIKAMDIVHYLDQPEVKRWHKLKKSISVATAQRWMQQMGYRWQKNPAGQFIDGHERDDVVYYRQTVFIPAWTEIEFWTRAWTKNNIEVVEEQQTAQWQIVVWFHDESTFYANDRRQV